MLCKAYIKKLIYHNNDYYVYGCLLDEPNKEIKLNSYHNFTIAGNLSYLSEGKSYELDVQEIKSGKYAGTYEVLDAPSLSSLDYNNLTSEQSMDLLTTATSYDLADELLSKCPNAVKLIMGGNESQIDVKQLNGIKKKRLATISRNVRERFRFYEIYSTFKQYEFSTSECQALDKKYSNITTIRVALEKNPYAVLIDELDRGFESSDVTIRAISSKWDDSDIRCEYLIMWALDKNELSGSTKMSASDMAQICNSFAPNLTKRLKEICESSDMIYYNSVDNIVAKQATYDSELFICNFIKSHKLTNKWCIDYTKYKDINEGKLTDEQSNILKSVCENGTTIVNARGGTGKTASLKAVIQMCEDNDKTYRLLAPTGKVSQRIKELTNRTASTIHRAVLSDTFYEDLIVCEEFSMVSVDILKMLLQNIENNNAHILFLGDLGQIPPISLGSPMKDIVNSKSASICTLSTVFRFKEGGLSKISSEAYDGINYVENIDTVRKTFGVKEDYTFVQTNNTLDQIIEEYKILLTEYTPQEISVITPWNVSELGSITINNAIQNLVNPILKDKFLSYSYRRNKIKFHVNDLIMNTKNNYHVITYESFIDDNAEYEECAVFNGEIGILTEIQENHFIVQFDDRKVVFENKEICRFLLAYCINSYKIQGSENKACIIITNKLHEEYLNKNLMYTNLTRARKKLVEIGDLTTINKCIKINAINNRNTFLYNMLKE